MLARDFTVLRMQGYVWYKSGNIHVHVHVYILYTGVHVHGMYNPL